MMAALRRLYARLEERFGRYRRQILYLIFGGLTTAIDWAVTFALYHFWIDATDAPRALVHVADVIAWVAAVLFAYVTNRRWVFGSSRTGVGPVAGELLTFAGGRVLALLLQVVIIFLFVTWLGLNKYLFRILAAVLVIILNYVFSKLFVFRRRQ